MHAEYDPAETPTALLDRLGRPLPPCIVMERGESLPDWSKRAKPDIFQSVAVLAHVATRLRDMHAAGYVHRDIKPENVMFLHRENRWTVIDFGCAAHSGEVAPLAYTLVYAPPEVAEAVDAGARTIEVTPAMDAWSLGVVAFELLTGQSAFKLVLEGRDSVRLLPRAGTVAASPQNGLRAHGLLRTRQCVAMLCALSTAAQSLCCVTSSGSTAAQSLGSLGTHCSSTLRIMYVCMHV